jgi:YfiH family protein
MAEERDDRLGGVVAELEERIDPAARPRVVARQLGAVPVLEVRLPGRLRAFFTTRVGGISTGVFSSLNLDPSSEDDPTAVARNRARITKVVDRQLLSPMQVHGVRVVGAAEYLQERPGGPCDGLTLHPELDRGIAAALLFADCVPVLLYGEVDMAVAHGGWRGILGGVVQQAGRAMMGPPAAAAIGPSIGPCCFAVGEEVARSYARRFGPEVVIGTGSAGDGLRVDLWEAVTKALAELGVPREQVINPRLCSVCNPGLFYSYRREGPSTGRHACVAWTAIT